MNFFCWLVITAILLIVLFIVHEYIFYSFNDEISRYGVMYGNNKTNSLILETDPIKHMQTIIQTLDKAVQEEECFRKTTVSNSSPLSTTVVESPHTVDANIHTDTVPQPTSPIVVDAITSTVDVPQTLSLIHI